MSEQIEASAKTVLLIDISSKIRDYGITSERPSAAAQGSGAYCAANKCYTTTEFVLLGLGAVIGGVMVGVIGISWFKYSVGFLNCTTVHSHVNSMRSHGNITLGQTELFSQQAL